MRVLIVEDDPMVAYLNEKYVKSFPEFKVIKKAKDGKEAIEILESEPFDLVILDVYMPKVNGLEVLREIRAKFIGVDVIFVTAAKEHEVIDQALKLGAIDYLVKPFEFDRFKIALKNYILRCDVFLKTEDISQKDIDELTKVQSMTNNTLPKGLQALTLNKIMIVMRENPNKYLSANNIAELAGISRVTVRRYLEYQESIGVLACEIKYGTVGRPTFVYKKIN